MIKNSYLYLFVPTHMQKSLFLSEFNLQIWHLSQVHSIETRSQPQQHYINPMLLGFVSTKGAEIGIQVTEESEFKNWEMIFTLKFLKRLKGKIEFEAVMKMNSHVQMVEKEWIECVPTEPNSFEFRSDIHRVLGECSSPAKICLMNITV